MEDVSESSQSGFRGLYKNRFGKKFHQKSLKDKMNNFNNMRRERRSTLIFQKRQIDENMSPIKTTESSKIIKHAIETKNIKTSNTRLEALQKWKMEKGKQKLKEKQKVKSLFKVCHVPDEFGLPYLNVNKNIERKTSKASNSNSRSQFAPPNHVFNAPKNIKPIYMNSVSNNVLSANLKIDLLMINTFPNYLARDKLSTRVTHKESIGSQRNTRATSRKHLEKLKVAENNKNSDGKIDMNKKTIKSAKNKQKTTNSRIESKNVKSKTRETILQDIKDQYSSIPSTSISSTKVKESSGKKCSLIHNKVAIVGDSRSTSLFNTNNISNNNKSVDVKSKGNESLKQKSEVQLVVSQEPLVKTVGWNCVEIIGEDSTNNENIKTPKTGIREYIKTPRKKHKLGISDVELINESDITEIKDSESQNISKNIEKSNSSSELRELNELQQKESDTKSGNSTVGSATGSASPDYPMDINSTELNNVFHTPQRNKIYEYPLVYISPSVTACQRKSSAEKECMGQSTGKLTPEFGADILNNTSPKVGADYFMKELNNEIHRIEEIRDVWESYKNSNKLPEEANDMINVAIGQSKLLITKKFQQFRNLIKQCKHCKYVEKPITCEDLHGFWDMTYIQVEDLNKQFHNLNALKANNWQEIIPEKKIDVKDKPKKTSTSTTIKNFKKPALDMKTSDTEYIINLNAAQIGESNEFSGGYLSDKLPVTSLKGPHLTSESARTSWRVSLLTKEAKNRVSSFPGLTAKKISQAIKCAVEVTPSKNILENDLTKSKKRITKSVLVKDNIEEDIETKVCVTETRHDNEVIESIVKQESIVNEIDQINSDTVESSVNKKNNDEINLIRSSPVTPLRKSKRLSKIK